jgi:hypothetical protein
MAEATPEITVPADFKKIIVDMTKDILVSFPEQRQNLHPELENLVFETDKSSVERSLEIIFAFCQTVYPPRFFDILYQKNEIFEESIEFLPGVNFQTLWQENITEKTRETLWKYLQLVLFNVVSSISNGDSLGDTAKLFEAINENEFKAKLEETIKQMQTLFGEEKKKEGGEGEGGGEGGGEGEGAETEGINLDDLPNPSDIHEHVTQMMNGKLGKLAREIAEETAADLNINMDNAASVSDVFKGLMNNPTKLMGLVKNVGSKLDEKMKSGEVKESELLAEASEMMKKMKNMPGMGDLQSMLSKMGMNAGKASGKVNVNAMQANLDQKLKKAKNTERLLKKMNDKRAQQEQEQAQQHAENLVFSTGETVERSSREQKPQAQQAQAQQAQAQQAQAQQAQAQQAQAQAQGSETPAAKKKKNKNKK